eukprot:13952546-Alexandrium_andersonii.AAC.1
MLDEGPARGGVSTAVNWARPTRREKSESSLKSPTRTSPWGGGGASRKVPSKWRWPEQLEAPGLLLESAPRR